VALTTPPGAGDADNQRSDEHWVALCRTGDERGFKELYRRHLRKVVGHLRMVLGPGADAEDLAQAVFEQAFLHIDRFAGRSKFSTWLFGITVRVAANARRASHSRAHAMDRFAAHTALGAPSAQTPEAILANDQTLRRLFAHLEKVPDKKRIPFLLYFVDQADLAEVAEMTGATVDNAWVRIKRARDLILRALGKDQQAEHRRMEKPQ